jgi:hypothetical protein
VQTKVADRLFFWLRRNFAVFDAMTLTAESRHLAGRQSWQSLAEYFQGG